MPRGREIAERIIRRHRFAERLVVDPLGVPWHEVHEEASQSTHAISPNVEAKRAALLGKPASCTRVNPTPA